MNMASFMKFKSIEEMAKHLAPRFQEDIGDGRVERRGDDVGLWMWVKRETGEGPTLAHIKQLRYLLEAEIDRFPKVVIYLKDGVVETCISNDQRLRVFIVDLDVATTVQAENEARVGAEDCGQVVYSDPDHSGRTHRAALEAEHGKVWDNGQAYLEFEVIGYMLPLTIVRRRSDGVIGTLNSTMGCGFFFNWQPREA